MMEKVRRSEAVEQIETALGGPGAVEAMWTTVRGNRYRREWVDRLWTAVLLVTRGEPVTFAHVDQSKGRPRRILLFTADLVVLIAPTDPHGNELDATVEAHHRGAPLKLGVIASEGVIDDKSMVTDAGSSRVTRFDQNWPGTLTVTVTFDGMAPLIITGEGLLDGGEPSPLLRLVDELSDALATAANTTGR